MMYSNSTTVVFQNLVSCLSSDHKGICLSNSFEVNLNLKQAYVEFVEFVDLI